MTVSTTSSARAQLYQELILDHARTPEGRTLAEAALPADGVAWAESHQVNPTCGDEITLRIELGQDGPRRPRALGRSGLLDLAGLGLGPHGPCRGRERRGRRAAR